MNLNRIKNIGLATIVATSVTTVSAFDGGNTDKSDKNTKVYVLKVRGGDDEAEKEYKKIVELADKLFDEGKYEDAKGYYLRAKAFKPEDPYPKQKLKEINDLQNPSTKVEEKDSDASRKTKADYYYDLQENLYDYKLKRANDHHGAQQQIEDFKDKHAENISGKKNTSGAGNERREDAVDVLHGDFSSKHAESEVDDVQETRNVRKNSFGEVIEETIERSVTVDGKKVHYKMVRAKWGTFYFKNGKSISEYAWDQETSTPIH